MLSLSYAVVVVLKDCVEGSWHGDLRGSQISQRLSCIVGNVGTRLRQGGEKKNTQLHLYTK